MYEFKYHRPATLQQAVNLLAESEDAMLIVELAKWGAMMELPEASRRIFADDFDAVVVSTAAYTVAAASTRNPAMRWSSQSICGYRR